MGPKLAFFYRVLSCGLSCDGSGIVSVFPLHDFRVGEQLRSIRRPLSERYPGFTTSQRGQVQSRAVVSTCVEALSSHAGDVPLQVLQELERSNCHHDNSFEQDSLKGLLSTCIWMDEGYIARLAVDGNTPGFTYLAARDPFSPCTFALSLVEFKSFIAAAHAAGERLRTVFGARWCGMLIDGHQISSAYIVLVPIHEPASRERPADTISLSKHSFDTYPGFFTTHFGPLSTATPQCQCLDEGYAVLKANHSNWPANSIFDQWRKERPGLSSLPPTGPNVRTRALPLKSISPQGREVYPC